MPLPFSVAKLAEANIRTYKQVGLLDVIDTDVGVDPVLDGDFHADLPPGHYVAVARSQDGFALSAPERVDIKKGQTTIWHAALPTPATLEYRVIDDATETTPAKIALISLDKHGKPMERDGMR